MASNIANVIESMPRRRVISGIPAAVVVVLVTAAVGSAVLLLQWDRFVDLFGTFCDEQMAGVISGDRCASGLNKVRIYTLALGLLPLIWLIEAWRPADSDQPVFSPGLLVDGLWFLMFPAVVILLRTPFENLLETVFGPPLQGFKLDLIATQPLVIQLVTVILLSDLLAWVSHWIRHKVPMLWEFHKIHHAQTQLNYFSTLRLHPGDFLANSLIRFLPFTLLGLQTGLTAYLVWSTFLRIYEMFVHSNIRTNLGPLRYIVVSPQSHRIHHSIEPEHIDRNLGNFFVFWDRLFRTQCYDFNAYPKLGVTDGDCPQGTATSVSGALLTLRNELVYPLQVFVKRWRRPASAQ